jgi:filamentous hemagglutinin family protein
MKNRFCLLVPAIAFLSIAHSAQAQILPDGTTATQVNGNAIAPTGIGTVNGGNLYHSFSELNVPQSGVIFNTGNSAVNGADVRNIINRVTGDNPSAILGTIESRQAFPNANLYLMNPNGIVFGQNARLDIGGSFHATTGTGLGFDNGTFNVDKNSLSFPSGDPKTIRFAIAKPAGIINQGNLAVDTGKSITFTGGSIINTGILTAPSGNIALTSVAGNSQVELRSPDAVLGLQVTANAVPTNWSGKITELPQLAELLTGKVPQADRVVVKADGSLALVASPAPTDIAVTNGMSIVSGKIDVSNPFSKGGLVGIFGEKVGLVNAQINASGVLGGGTVLIGGDLQGKGIAPNAQYTYIDNKSIVDVSALANGNGGKTIVWSDRTTRFFGTILAKGGLLSGDGGFVEVSGKENLLYRGNVNTSASNGDFGTLLLDPTDITIITATGTTDDMELSPNNPTAGDPAFSIFFTDGIPSSFTISNSALNVATSNIILQAQNDININGNLNITNTNVGFTAQAGNNININNVNIDLQEGNLTLRANDPAFASGIGSVNITNSVIQTKGGNFSIQGVNANLSNTTIRTSRFVSSVISNGNISINVTGNINAATSDQISGILLGLTGTSGAVNLNVGGNISVRQILSGADFSSNGNSGNIAIVAGGNFIASGALTSGNNGSGNGADIFIQSGEAIDTSAAIVSSGLDIVLNTTANAGNIRFIANGDIRTTDMASGITAFFSTGNGGSINLTSNSGSIFTSGLGTGTVGTGRSGDITVQARNSITTGTLASVSVQGNAGNIVLDPIGDIAVNGFILASGLIQGGNVSISTTGGNIRVRDTIPASISGFSTGSCAGASICSASNSGNSGGQISIQHGGLNPFTIGDSSINGTAGFVTTGSSTLALGTIIPVGNSSFTQGNVIVSPYGLPANTIVSSDESFNPPKVSVGLNTVDLETQNLLEIRDVMKKEVDRFLKEENLEKAFDAIEKAYVSELGIFLGEDLKPPVLNLDQARDMMSDASKRSGSVSALIYPIILNNRIEIMVIPPKGLGKPFHRYTNYANENEIITALTDYRASLRDTESLDYLEQGQKLYNWVMRPIDAQLQAMKIETVVFVMDSGLRVIPPAALHDGKQFLVERYASANIPSLRVTRLEDRDRKNSRVLAMGLTEAKEGLSALPTVEVEIRTISKQVLAGSGFLDRDFTIKNMQEQRGKANYGILHFATHGKFLEDRAKDSYIQFWDSKLRSQQIPSLRFDQPVIEMLTLSACETAVGNNLGISGLAVESGARSILASLWAVSDVGTAPLMISFYKAFPNALSKATALRQAQLDLLKGKVKIENNQIVGINGIPAIALPKGTGNVDIKHPFFWSSFILVGNWL